jgi:nucleoside-diphosphate-sugar epimerase
VAANDGLLTEDAAFNPITPYGESKVLTERDVASLADKTFTPVFLRNATAYGTSSRLRLDLVVNEFVATAVLDGFIHIRSDGTPWRPVVHVEDICRAFAAVLVAPREAVHNEAFNVGRNEENYRVSDLAKIVQNAVSGSIIQYAMDGLPDKRCYRVDCSKLPRHVPTFQPAWTVERGVRQLVEAFRNVPLTQDKVQQQRYLRLPTLRRLMASESLGEDLRMKDDELSSVTANCVNSIQEVVC